MQNLHGEPLIGVQVEKNGKQETYYFTDEKAADKAASAINAKIARDLAGAWKKLKWNDLEEGLNHIRHQTPPSKPLSL